MLVFIIGNINREEFNQKEYNAIGQLFILFCEDCH